MNLLINIDVDDLQRAIQFYTHAFDLQIGRHLGANVVELLGATAPIYLLQKPEGSQASLAANHSRAYSRHWTPIHFDIVVDDIDTTLNRAVTAGAIVEQDVQSHQWGKLALMADPFGHGFCLVQFVGRGYDEIALE